jgi:hypothetical protein
MYQSSGLAGLAQAVAGWQLRHSDTEVGWIGRTAAEWVARQLAEGAIGESSGNCQDWWIIGVKKEGNF